MGRTNKGIHKSFTQAAAALVFLLLAGAPGLSFGAGTALAASGSALIGDSAGELTPEQALARASAGGDAAGESVAIDTRTYWWVGHVSNPASREGRWVVHLGNTAIERAELYLFDKGQRVAERRVDLIETAREGLPAYTVGYHLPFTVPPHARRTVVLKIETPVAHQGLIYIKPYRQAKIEAHYHMVAVWTAAGAMAALIVYNLFLGLGLRLPVYLFYVGHASGHLLYLLTAMGRVGTGLPVLERYLFLNIPGIIIGVLFGAVFIYRFLELPTLSPSLARIYRVFIAAMCLMPVLGFVLEPAQLLTAARSSHLVLTALVIAAGIAGVVKRRREALYVLVGWGVMVALTARGMLGVLGVMELTIDAGIWAFWAILFEMFFLSLALADRVRRLSHEKQMAEQASEAKSAFLANMSHEIRTPLNGVLGMVDTLAQTPMDERQKQYLQHIRQSGATLLSVLDDVLEYSRVEAGKVQLNPVNFSPNSLLDELRNLLGPVAEHKGLRLLVEVAPSVPQYLLGDVGRIRQVLLNLVGNAIKFTEQGEVRVRVEGEDRSDGLVQVGFSVSDTGIGIAEDAQGRIFSRFHQADGSIRRRYGGSGLGLAIARELVELMHGDIIVESREGEGSRFLVHLPMPAGQEQAVAAGPTVELPPLHILVVEDEPVNRLVVHELLGARGHRVEAVDGGQAALDLLERESFDLVLMDLSMPDMDGLEATRRLRARGWRIPVIGLTAHVLAEQTRACLEAGMDAVIHKPLEVDRLNAIVAPFVTPSLQPANAAG